MKNLLLAVALLPVLPASSTVADEAKEVEKAIDALNKAFEKSDARAVKGLMAADHVAVTTYYGGPLGRDEQIKGLADHKLESYKSERMQVRMLSKEAALVTYALTMKGTYKGKPVPAKSHASAVWVRRDGKWLEAFYQETPLGEK